MELVDTHCHIQSIGVRTGEPATRELWAKAPDISAEQVVTAAAAAGVTRLVCVGCDLADSQLAIDFVQERQNCWASIGIHPHEAAGTDDSLLAEFAALTERPKVIAIGECGLDYFYEHSPRPQQLKVLKFQLELAVAAGWPVIFHVREAFDDFWPLYDSFPAGTIRGVLHSFTDSEPNLQMALERGLYIGVNGIVTFVKQPAQLKIYQSIPDERLLLETDAPFLTPVPFRGKVNTPQLISTVANYLAQLRNQPLEQLAQITTANARALFAI